MTILILILAIRLHRSRIINANLFMSKKENQEKFEAFKAEVLKWRNEHLLEFEEEWWRFELLGR